MEITSDMIVKADGTTGQNIRRGTGIKTPHIQNGAVRTDKIDNGAVTETKIANGAVTESKIRAQSVTTSKIKDRSVGKAKIANDSVTHQKLDANTRGRLVTNGDNHDHSKGNGAKIKHSSLILDDGSNPHNVGMSQLNDLNANHSNITNLAYPVQYNDSATKGYVDEKTGGTVSSSSNIYNVSTVHTRQVNASINSTASGDRSQVNASDNSTASHQWSQVNASYGVETGADFTICGGWGHDPYQNNRKWELNSLNGNITCASINGQPSFTDYGEYFENFAKGEIDMGVLIVLEGAKVRPAKKDEDFIGVVSGTAAIRLGDSFFCWQGRYMKDEWGRPVYEEIKDPAWQPKTVPDKKWQPKRGETEADRPMIAVESEKDRPTIRVQKENPDYDPKKEQVPRSERPEEWTLVGLLGQVYVRCDDTVKPGDFVKSKDKGIGTKADEETRMRAMKVTKEYDGKHSIVYCLLI